MIVTTTSCLLTLFVAMTLASLGWIGVETSLWCEYYFLNCNKTSGALNLAGLNNSNQDKFPVSIDASSTIETDSLYMSMQNDGLWNHLIKDRVYEFTKTKELREDNICDVVLEPGFCGWSVQAPRILYSFLMLLGITQATVSFMMAAIACTSRSIDPRQRRISVSFLYENDTGEAPQRGIRAWELPPTLKEIEAGLAEPQARQAENNIDIEAPPPYEALPESRPVAQSLN
ncbi:hypothetical protein QYM36_000279 [Artemia franciscana]|nr:hypothetical protein QYM36_000279 [Artemia franciscana]